MEEPCQARLMLKFLWRVSTSVTVSADDLKTAVANYVESLWLSTSGALIDAYYPKDERKIVIRSMIQSKIYGFDRCFVDAEGCRFK